MWCGVDGWCTADAQSDVETLNARDFLKNRRVVNVYSIGNYAESYVFRDVVLALCFLVFIIFSFFVGTTACSGCNTPYKVVAIVTGIAYLIRFGILWYHLTYFFAHFNTMTKEIFSYQHGFDRVGESRMFNDVVPDLHWPNQWWWSGVIDAGFFVTTLALSALGSMWLSGNECAVRCTRLFHYMQYLIAGVFVVEGLYIISVLLLRFYRRASGVEAVQDLLNHLYRSDHSISLDDKTTYTRKRNKHGAIQVAGAKNNANSNKLRS